jgi:hypothetical protein
MACSRYHSIHHHMHDHLRLFICPVEEQSSYSPMLNIAESVPSTEPVSSNSAFTQFSEFRTGIASTYCGLTFEHNTTHVGEGGGPIPVWNCVNWVKAELDGIERNSGIFGIGTDSGNEWNWWELVPGIGRIGGKWFRGAEPVPQCSTLRNRTCFPVERI